MPAKGSKPGERDMVRCHHCGSVFESLLSAHRKFCSRKCYELDKRGKPSPMRGKRHTDEARKKMSNALKGRRLSEDTRRKMVGRTPWNKGMTASEEYRRNISQATRGIRKPRISVIMRQRRGPLANAWKGGRTAAPKRLRNSIAYAEWRTAVMRRDDYTCQWCGTRGGKLHVHHIFPLSSYPDWALHISNGITVCESCHRFYHRTGMTPEEETVMILHELGAIGADAEDTILHAQAQEA